MSEKKNYTDPKDNPFIKRDTDTDTSEQRKYPDRVSADEVKEAAYNILVNRLECESKIESVNDEILINGKRSINLEWEDIVPILDTVKKEEARIQAAKREAESEKYRDPARNPLIKLDPDK